MHRFGSMACKVCAFATPRSSLHKSAAIPPPSSSPLRRKQPICLRPPHLPKHATTTLPRNFLHLCLDDTAYAMCLLRRSGSGYLKRYLAVDLLQPTGFLRALCSSLAFDVVPSAARFAPYRGFVALYVPANDTFRLAPRLACRLIPRDGSGREYCGRLQLFLGVSSLTNPTTVSIIVRKKPQ